MSPMDMKGIETMKKIWMFLTVGMFAFGLLTSQAVAKDLDRLDKMEKLDRMEAIDKQMGVHVDLPADAGAGANGLQSIQNRAAIPGPRGIQNRNTAPVQGIQNRNTAPAAVPDAPFSNFPHAPGVDHG
jgi:hypothetical protein